MLITSTQNSLIKEVLALRKTRKESDLILIDGMREIQRALSAGVKIEKIFYSSKLLIDFDKSKLVEVSEKVFEKITYGERGTGAVALARVFPRKLSDLKLPSNPFVVVLESVEKPGNLGAIVRTCDGAGVDALLICDPKTDIYNPNVIRASTGTVFHVPVAAGTNEQIADFLQRKKISVAGAFPEAAKVYTQANLKGPLALALGTEDKGLSPFWQKRCDQKLKIPMQGWADSLNVSVSAAILIYEARRQRS